MKKIVQKLAGTILLTLAALVTGRSQNATTELHVKDIDTQQPQEKLAASPPCQQAFANPEHGIIDPGSIDLNLNTFISDLSILMQKSDEVILAGINLRHTVVFSPSGQSAVSYFDVKVLRSWKGPHSVGDTVTFGVPAGVVHCGMTESNHSVYFSTIAGSYSKTYRAYVWKMPYFQGPYLLFLRHPQGRETQLVQTLFPAAGQGLQGMFPIQFPVTGEEERQCNGALHGSVQWCDSFLETSQYPVVVPYVPDPLGKKYDGMPIADFLNVVQNLAADQGLDEKRP